MFLQVQGVVQDIKSNERTGDYGPYYQFFIDLIDQASGQVVTVSTSGKKPTPAGKPGPGQQGNWASITPGATIHVLYTQNGDYNNSKASQITVLQAGNGQAPAQRQPQQQAPQQQAPRAATGGVPVASSKTLEIKAGRAVNAAVSIFTSGKADTLEAALREAVRLEVLSDKYYEKIYAQELAKPSQGPGAPASQPNPVASQAAVPQQPQYVPEQYEQPQQAAPAQTQAAPAQGGANQAPPEDDFDDDLPF